MLGPREKGIKLSDTDHVLSSSLTSDIKQGVGISIVVTSISSVSIRVDESTIGVKSS